MTDDRLRCAAMASPQEILASSAEAIAAGSCDVVYLAKVFEHLQIDPIFTAAELH
jgi:hypothetical protein